jgi:hypothetical protein
MSTSVLTLPAPGWYPDPVGVVAYRWWDGETWTQGTHDGAVDAHPVEATTAEPAFAEPAFAEPATVEPAFAEPATVEPAAFQPIPLFADPAQAPISAPAVPIRPATASAPTPAPRRGVRPSKTRWSSMLLAFPFVYPIAVGMIVALAYAGGAASNTTTLIVIGATAGLILLAPAWIIADHDRKELLARGYEPAPSLIWMLLLPPVAYLLARRRVVGPSY